MVVTMVVQSNSQCDTNLEPITYRRMYLSNEKNNYSL